MTAVQAAHTGLVLSVLAVLQGSLADPDAPGADKAQVRAEHAMMLAAREYALAVDALFCDDQPFNWMPVIPGGAVLGVLATLQNDVAAAGWTEFETGRAAGLNQATSALRALLVGPASSVAGTGPRFEGIAGQNAPLSTVSRRQSVPSRESW